MSAFVGLPIDVRIAVALGLTGCAWTSGANLSCSYIAGGSLTDPLPPSAVAPPVRLSRMWQNVYNRGGKMVPPAAIGTSLAFAYAAYFTPTNVPNSLQHARTIFAVCSLITISVIPFWLIVMAPTINALNDRAAAPQARGEKHVGTTSVDDSNETKKLITKWAWLNGVKGVYLFAAMGLGFSVILF
ncbi:hypothetical protein GYMLUDRAFT_57664 [Collybiopsis luxurians FD-317 M1]|uniref:DUF1772-domain-containing protein n=1 Tax=Collybiopsis luxurians FD-317 M1 TaxID=944289 RepID=A0A0D0D2N9_9AGAR|nr:hypothetical protein GYMLUDRAFT_57664 [Collybiopsis luxurians FD-317 M1]